MLIGEFDVSPELASTLGEQAIDFIRMTDPLMELQCQFCGGVKPGGSSERMAIVAGTGSDRVPITGFAHVRCRDEHGDEIVPRDNFQDERTRFHVCLKTRTVRPRIGICLEPYTTSTTADGEDEYVGQMLSLGFQRTTMPHLDLIAPSVAPRWTIDIEPGRLVLRHPWLGVLSDVRPTEPAQTKWLARAAAQSHILVVTGIHLHLSAHHGSDLRQPAEAGTLIAALVAVNGAEGAGAAKRSLKGKLSQKHPHKPTRRNPGRSTRH